MQRLKRSPVEIADLLVRKHGLDAVAGVVAAFRAGASSKKIAAEIGVTRVEVWRWRKALGVETRTFSLHREVEVLLRGAAPPSRV